MKVLFVAAESDPFVKTGGLGDVIGALPQQLAAQGMDVRVILPKYARIPERYQGQMQHVGHTYVPVGWRNQYAGIERLVHGQVTYYFVDNEYYFKRDGIYGYADEAERYAFFARAVLEVLPMLGFQPDVVHAHDWQAGLVPVFLHAHYASSDWHQGIRTIFTIHNLAYQGVFPRSIMSELLSLGDAYFTSDKLEYHGAVNYLKGGIVYADLVTTVSDTYAQEIQTAWYGEGLDPLLWARRNSLVGILNGIDTGSYDPATDEQLFVRYNASADQGSAQLAEQLQVKRQNKLALQEQLHLPMSTDVPLIALITRLTRQKGLDLVLHVLDEILAHDVQLVLLGTGDAHYEAAFRQAEQRHGDRVRALVTFDDRLARQLYAASDLFLMPSLFEPCGLSQLIALRYLSVPIVRETGGLRDTVRAFDEHTGAGNGFSFAHINAHDMLFTIGRAVQCYHDRERWQQIIQNATQCDFSWPRAAQHYRDLYQRLLHAREAAHVR